MTGATPNPRVVNTQYDDLETYVEEWRIKGESYLLYEASGEASTKHRNFVLSCRKYDGNGNLTVNNMAEAEPLLVSLCLKEKETGQAVHIAKIKSWPERVQKDLFNRIKEISQLREAVPDADALIEALKREDSPISLVALRDWIASLEDAQYAPALRWLNNEIEDNAKN